MQVIIKNSFQKDVQKINDKLILQKLHKTITELSIIDNLQNIINCRKLRGSENYFRIKLNNYRIGFKFENNTIVLLRFLHRKEIYRFFP